MDDLVNEIKSRLDQVNSRVEKACKKAGRQVDDVKVVVVSKTKPPEIIEAAIQAGVKCFGENYPDETAGKIPQIRKSDIVEWHMIGHCQSRKINYLVRYFNCMHSLDNLGLAIKLNDHLIQANKILPVLLEINVAGEKTKNGWQIGDIDDIRTYKNDFDIISNMSNINWIGLMTMPPLSADIEISRSYFRRLRQIRSTLQDLYPKKDLQHLSMGTSSDFEVAIEEGATLVRIGQAILGPRQYQ